jgi:CSLREA domain-containing protein
MSCLKKDLFAQITILICLLAFFLFIQPAAAQSLANTYTVNTTVDTYDGNCDSNCSLRDAIAVANATGGGPHTVIIPAGTYQLTRAGIGENNSQLGDLDLWNSPMIIQGAGSGLTTINGGALDAIFEINGQAITMSGLTLRNGIGAIRMYNGANLTISDSIIRNNTNTTHGGGITSTSVSDVLTLNNVTIQSNNVSANTLDGAGIYALGTLNINNSTIFLNGATALQNGGGIFSNGTLTMVGGTVNSNGITNTKYGSGIYMYQGTLDGVTISNNGGANSQSGGGVYLAGFATLQNVTITGNRAELSGFGTGGGIYAINGMTLTNSTVNNNIARNGGGGIYTVYGTYTLSYLTIDGNSTVAYGGGINARNGDFTLTFSNILNNSVTGTNNNTNGGGGVYLGNDAYFEIRNSLFYNNSVSQGSFNSGGGAIYIGDAATGELTNLTLSNNNALATAQGAGIYFYSSAPTAITNLTIDFNYAATSGNAGMLYKNAGATGTLTVQNTLFGSNQNTTVSCIGTFTSLGNNLDTKFSCGPAVASDQQNQLITLLSLDNNGGPTLTKRPTSSNIIDHGSNIGCPATDQRGAIRPGSGVCDIGAYEKVLASSSTLTASKSGNSYFLNWMINSPGCLHEIHRSTDPYTGFASWVTNLNVTTYNITGNTGFPGTNYYYKIFVNCITTSTNSNKVGEFDFAIVPGT